MPFPHLLPREISQACRDEGGVEAMSAANANVCIANLSSFLNWAVNEELLDRNPARGLRLPDDTAKRDKRLPFSAAQLRSIFNAPLFRGCMDGDRGYSKPGTERPRNARFWVPLIGLHSGMRLNEICQLDVTDVRVIEGIACFVVTQDSLVESTDKILKTGASDRVVPLHPTLLDFGLVEHASKLRRAGQTKLFGEIDPGTKGIRAVAFSKWFTQFLRNCGARRDRTSFHSFRHNFRDELRAARIDFDIAMALGGWASSSAAQRGVSENYGSGHRVRVLQEAIARLRFSDVDLSHIGVCQAAAF